LFAVSALAHCSLFLPAGFRATTPQQQSQSPAAALPLGVVIERVPCVSNTSQTYALYLPKTYTPARKWPVLFAFDPMALGKGPVNLAKDAAERFGYIVAGSNNARNGPTNPEREAALAMMQDVIARFSADPARFYTTGFSGGARVATAVALICKTCIAGVFAHAAGFPNGKVWEGPTNMEPSAEIHFSYFSAAGDMDSNFSELVELERTLDSLGVPNCLRRYAGVHQWAPAEVWMEALAWFELRAMREGRREKDAELISSELAAAQGRAAAFEKSGDLFAAWEEYRKWAELFDGLADATALAARAAGLKNSAAVQQGQRDEAEEIRRQREWTDNLIPEMNAIAVDNLHRSDLLGRIRAEYAALREASEAKKVTPKVKAAQRAVHQVWGVAFDSAYFALNAGNFELARTYAELLVEMAPERPGPHLMLARVHAAAGRRKQAIGEITRAVEKGLKDPEALRDTPEFNSLSGDPQFKDLIARVERAASAHPSS
jgi:tetratricopeptide (TPR) repeat protein